MPRRAPGGTAPSLSYLSPERRARLFMPNRHVAIGTESSTRELHRGHCCQREARDGSEGESAISRIPRLDRQRTVTIETTLAVRAKCFCGFRTSFLARHCSLNRAIAHVSAGRSALKRAASLCLKTLGSQRPGELSEPGDYDNHHGQDLFLVSNINGDLQLRRFERICQ